MLGFAGNSFALFAVIWAALCLLSGALVTDAMLRAAPPAIDAEQGANAVAEV